MYVIYTIPPAHVPMRNQKYLAIPGTGKPEYTWTTSWSHAKTFPSAYHARNAIADIKEVIPDVSLNVGRSMILSSHIIEELVSL